MGVNTESDAYSAEEDKARIRVNAETKGWPKTFALMLSIIPLSEEELINS